MTLRENVRISFRAQIPSFKPLWGVFALKSIPTKRYLWATTASVPFESGHEKSEEGRCALLKIDLKTRKLVHRYECEAGDKHEAGDMTASANGDVFVSDGASGDECLCFVTMDRSSSAWCRPVPSYRPRHPRSAPIRSCCMFQTMSRDCRRKAF